MTKRQIDDEGRLRFRQLLLGLLVAVSMVVAACGGNVDDESAPSGEVDAGTEAGGAADASEAPVAEDDGGAGEGAAGAMNPGDPNTATVTFEGETYMLSAELSPPVQCGLGSGTWGPNYRDFFGVHPLNGQFTFQFAWSDDPEHTNVVSFSPALPPDADDYQLLRYSTSFGDAEFDDEATVTVRDDGIDGSATLPSDGTASGAGSPEVAQVEFSITCAPTEG